MRFLGKGIMQELLISSFFSIASFRHKQLFDPCIYAWEALAQIEGYLKKQKLGNIEINLPEGVHIIHPELISIGKGTVVEPGAFIKGPCIIGDNCEIRMGAYIREDVIIGDRSVIGHGSEIKHSILLNEVHAGHFNYVGDSILGNLVNLGAGVKCANLRLDHAPITLKYHSEIITTGLKKLGAIIGDEAQIGCNSVTNPGTFIGKKVLCHPCMAIQGYIPHFAKVKTTQKMVIE